MTIRWHRGALDTATAFLAALVAGLSLMVPIDFAWTSTTSAVRVDLLVVSLPRAIAAGALVAVVAAVLSNALGGQLMRWGWALGGVTLLFVNHLLGRNAVLGTSLATLNFLDSIAGGLILGGSGAAVLARGRSAIAWLLGAICGVVIEAILPETHPRTVEQHFPQNWPAIDAPPMWLIVLALVLIAVGAYREPAEQPAETSSLSLPILPIIAGTLVIGMSLFGSEWLARHGDSLPAVAATVVVTVAAALLAALLLPDREGTMVLLAVGLAGAGSAVLTNQVPSWTIPLMIGLVLVGLLAGSRWPSPRVAVVAVIGLSAYAVLEVAAGHSTWSAGAGHAGLSLVAGYSFASITPRYGSTRVLGISLIYVPSPVLALRDYVNRGHCLLTEHGKPCDYTDFTSYAPGWMATATACASAFALWLLWRRRPIG